MTTAKAATEHASNGHIRIPPLTNNSPIKTSHNRSHSLFFLYLEWRGLEERVKSFKTLAGDYFLGMTTQPIPKLTLAWRNQLWQV